MKIPNPNYLIAKVIAHFAITMVMGILFLETARAALTWNQGGGNWDTTSANWTGDATTFISDGTQDVIFDNAAGGTITISASMEPASTTVSATSGTYTFNGGPITGSGGLTKSGDGQLTMNTANNSYTGKTSIERGTLLFGGAACLSNAGSPGVFGAPAAGANATIDLNNGVTLRSNGSNPRVNQSTDRPLNLAGSGYGTVSIRYNDNDASLTFGDVTVTGTGGKVLKVDTGINGNGDRQAINFTGGIANSTDNSPTSLEVTFNTQGSSNWVSLAGINTFTGPITLSQINGTANGVLVVGGFRVAQSGANTIGTGSLGSGNYPGDITLGARTVLEYDSTAPQTLSGAISGAGAILLTGSGPVTLSGTNTYAGNTTVNSGCSLTLGSTGSFGFLLGNTTTNKITGAGSATLNGTFSVDTSAVTAVTGTWTLVDATTRSYGTSFGLTNFTGPVGTVYTNQEGTKIWTFDTSTSALSLTSTAVFTSFTYNGFSGVIDHVNGTIKLPVSSGTAAATVAPIFSLTSGTSSSVSGAAPTWDSNNEATYTITDTSTDPATVNVYTVMLKILPVPPGFANGMMLWLAADDIDPADTSQVDNSGNVQQWNDLSGNSFNASNATASQRPAYITNALNGKPALRFNQDASSKLFLGDLSASFWATIADTYPTAVNSGTGGTGINGTYVNVPTRAVTGALVGDSDTATALNGSNQSVSIPYSASLNPPQGQPWSAEIWAKSNVAGVLPPFSSGTPGNVPNRQGWVLYFFNSDLSFRAYTNNGANATINGGNGLTIPGVITPQTWYHVVVTCDGTDFKIFLNGVEVGTTPTVGPNGTYSAGTDGTGLGIRVGAGNYFNGVLDEAAFYTTTLSQSRIQAHYDNGINNPERTQAYDLEIAADSPVAHYKLNEPAGPVAAASVFAVAAPNNDGRYNLFGNRANDDRWVANSWTESSPGAFRTGRANFGSAGFALWPSSGSHVYLLESGPSQYRFVIDGNENAALATSGGYNSGAGVNWTIGDSAANNDQRFNGDIAELIFYNRVLSTDEVNAVGYYLKNKYGVAATYLNPNATAPENFVAIASDGIVALSWSRFIGATSYDVKRSSTQNGPYVSIGTTIETSLTDSQVVNGTPYYYVVSAVTATSVSMNSAEISATPTGVDATRSTVVSSQPILLADGVAYTTITVTLLNANDVPMADKTVQLTKTSGTGLPNIQVVSDFTGDDGKATFIVDSQDAGTFVFTATDVTSNVEINQTATVEFAAATTTSIVVVSSGSPTTYGQNVTFTATVSPIPSGGKVQFWVGENYLGGEVTVNASGEASVTTTTLAAGSHAITADYSGNLQFGASSTAAMISQEVGKAPLTVRATSFVRPTNTPNPDPLPSAFFGYQNGENILTFGVTGTPLLSTDAVPESPVGDYPITCALGTLAADNYSFTLENGTMTVAEPVPTTLIFGGDFQVYKPGTGYYVKAEFTGGNSYAGGVGDGKSLTGGTITYADGTSGIAGDGIPDFDLPGWEPLRARNDLMFNGVGGSTGMNIFGSWGGQVRIQTTGSLFTVAAGQSVTITAMVGGPDDGPITGPLAFHLVANGVQLVPTSIVNPTLPNGGAFQMISRTYSAAVLAPHIGATTKIVLGVEDANNIGNRVIFDDVKLEMTSAPAGYGSWANANGASGQTAGEDHDNDGVPNGIEFFMGATGSSFTANATLNANNEIAWPASAAYQGTYEVQTSSDLVVWTPVATQPVPSGGFLTYSLPASAQGGKSFVRLFVAPTP